MENGFNDFQKLVVSWVVGGLIAGTVIGFWAAFLSDKKNAR